MSTESVLKNKKAWFTRISENSYVTFHSNQNIIFIFAAANYRAIVFTILNKFVYKLYKLSMCSTYQLRKCQRDGKYENDTVCKC